MNEASARLVNAYWATMFGCAVADLRPLRGRAYAHDGFANYHGVHAMMFGEAAPIVSVPDDLLSLAEPAASTWLPGSIRATAQLTGLLGARVGLVIGPAVLAYADATMLRAAKTQHPVRRLSVDSSDDRRVVAALRDGCTSDEWEMGSSNLGHDIVFGAFAGAALAAVAGYEVWGDTIAHIAIITDPARRGHGFGKAAVLAAAQHALEHCLVPQYRTLESNTSARGVATSLGFVPLATSFAVRFRAFSFLRRAK